MIIVLAKGKEVMKIELEFELSEKDYISYNLDHARTSPTIKRSIMFQRFLGPVMFLIVPFVIKRKTTIPMLFWLSLFGIVSIIWVVFYPRYVNWEMGRRLTKMLKEANNKNLLSNRRLIISENGVSVWDKSGESHVDWDSVTKVENTNDYIYIYVSSVSAHIIPKRVFKDENEKQMFIKELSKYIDF